jgi:putative transposase
MDGDLPNRRRLHRREEPDGVRFVTFSCYRRLPLLKNAGICRLLVEQIERARARDGVEVIAWVIMPEHVHLLARPGPGVPLGRSLRRLKMAVSRRVLSRWQAMNAAILKRVCSRTGPRFWQAGGGFDRNVRDDAELSSHIRYIHDNPVARGLVGEAAEWRWSSVHWWVGRREDTLACCYPRGEGWDRWRGFMSGDGARRGG